MKSKIILVWMISFIWISCESEIDVQLPDYDPKLVIDGYIEQGKFARVALTESASYFEDIDEDKLKRASVVTAKVTVTDGENTDILTLRKNVNGFPPLIYEGTDVRGEVGKTYRLTIENKGQTYSAQTTILPPPTFDSLWTEHVEGEEGQYVLKGRFTDNEDEENYYRIFTRRKNKDNKYIPLYLLALGDKFFDGKTLNLDILRGAENYADIDNDLYFESGDTVLVRFCSMDKTHFDFWRTIEREVYATGNPFSSSGNKILYNTSEGSIGIWGGYGASYEIVVVE